MRRTGEYAGMLMFRKNRIGKVELRPPERWLRGDPLRNLEEHAIQGGLAREDELVRKSLLLDHPLGGILG